MILHIVMHFSPPFFLLFKVFNFYMGVQWEAENYETADDI